MVAEYDLSADGLALIDQVGSTRIYENCLCQPRAWVDAGNGETREAEIPDYSPNLITILADGPGTLILSEVMYPGWQVLVDGVPAEGQTVQNLLRSVTLDEGSHIRSPGPSGRSWLFGASGSASWPS